MAKGVVPNVVDEPSGAAHPEEMQGNFDLRIGKFVQLQGSGRLTPAGLVCFGIATAAVFLSLAALARALRPIR